MIWIPVQCVARISRKKNQVHCVSICSVSRIIDNHKFRSMMPLVSSYCNTIFQPEICDNFLQINVNQSKLFSTPSPLLSSHFSLSISVNLAFPRPVNDISWLWSLDICSFDNFHCT